MMGESFEKVEADADKLTGQGVDARVVSSEQLDGLFPCLSDCGAPFDLSGETEHVCAPAEAFLFEPSGGYADPVGANQDLIEATRVHGGAVEFNSRVTGVVKENGRVTGVRLEDGSTISAARIPAGASSMTGRRLASGVGSGL